MLDVPFPGQWRFASRAADGSMRAAVLSVDEDGWRLEVRTVTIDGRALGPVEVVSGACRDRVLAALGLLAGATPLPGRDRHSPN